MAFGIFLLAGATVGGVWLVSDLTGPLEDELPPHLESEGVFLVTYQLGQYEVQTETLPFSRLSSLHFGGLGVPVQNVTTVEVTLQVSMGGPAINDQYEVTVRDPHDVERTGSHTVPNVSPGGYIRSDTIITWKRGQQPPAESYRTTDPEKAREWSADNHTDPSAHGNWSGEVTLSPPLAMRSGNASLLLHFTYFEAIVLPKTPATPPLVSVDPPPNNTTAPSEESTPTAQRQDPAQALPSDASFEAVPRTFITTRSVGETVDRGRTADRPL